MLRVFLRTLLLVVVIVAIHRIILTAFLSLDNIKFLRKVVRKFIFLFL